MLLDRVRGLVDAVGVEHDAVPGLELEHRLLELHALEHAENLFNPLKAPEEVSDAPEFAAKEIRYLECGDRDTEIRTIVREIKRLVLMENYNLADIALVAMHTPGHTEGSTCFYLPSESALFSGDVLFKGNVGRVDLPGGDARAMEQSLARVAGLPPQTRVYPGHGALTTIGAELAWLRGFRFV